jgi:hypothetical protein
VIEKFKPSILIFFPLITLIPSCLAFQPSKANLNVQFAHGRVLCSMSISQKVAPADLWFPRSRTRQFLRIHIWLDVLHRETLSQLQSYSHVITIRKLYRNFSYLSAPLLMRLIIAAHHRGQDPHGRAACSCELFVASDTTGCMSFIGTVTKPLSRHGLCLPSLEERLRTIRFRSLSLITKCSLIGIIYKRKYSVPQVEPSFALDLSLQSFGKEKRLPKRGIVPVPDEVSCCYLRKDWERSYRWLCTLGNLGRQSDGKG